MRAIKQILAGCHLEDFQIREHNNCAIGISGGFGFTTEALLRYVGNDETFITVEDHNQEFGLTSPFDAEKEIESKIMGKEILDVSTDLNTGDLRIHLVDGVIEVLATSSGYEQFQLNGPDLVMVGYGGKQTTEQVGGHNSGGCAPSA